MFPRLRDKSHSFDLILLKLAQIAPITIEIYCQILWEKEPFKIVNFLSFTRSSQRFFHLILLKLIQIVCIIIDTNPIENQENSSNIIWTGAISNFGYFFRLRNKSPYFYPVLLTAA